LSLCGAIGILFCGVLCDRLGAARKGAYALVPALAMLIVGPLYAAGALSTSLPLTIALFAVPTAFGVAWLAPVVAAVQQIVGPAMRATASACFLFINNLIGIGFGTIFFGLLSDVLTPRLGDEALRWSIVTGTGFALLSALLFLLASRTLERDWHR
jgi:MFS family permease